MLLCVELAVYGGKQYCLHLCRAPPEDRFSYRTSQPVDVYLAEAVVPCKLSSCRKVVGIHHGEDATICAPDLLRRLCDVTGLHIERGYIQC